MIWNLSDKSVLSDKDDLIDKTDLYDSLLNDWVTVEVTVCETSHNWFEWPNKF